MGRLPLSGGDVERSETEGVGITRPYRHIASLHRRAGGDTRPYGVPADLARRAHTVRPYGVSADLVRRAAKTPGDHPPGARGVEASAWNDRPPSGSGRGVSPVSHGRAGGVGSNPGGHERKVLETLVSKRFFRVFLIAQKDTRPQAKQPQPPSPVKFLIPNSSFLILNAPSRPQAAKPGDGGRVWTSPYERGRNQNRRADETSAPTGFP